ncbi:MAG: PKD domain-containing protein, partial [Candidatus Delongbacteria bacterium]|nr:PKD domain-containing protein [Candidatus Delongbacteria bacterium]
MKKLILLTTLIFTSLSLLFAQSFDMVADDGQTVSTCSAAFSAGSYTPGETYTLTVCSDDALDHHVTISISSYSFPAGTSLCVYDGQNASAPELVCWDETTTAGMIATQAQNTNESGCLTFVFDAGTSGASWSGTFSCNFVCQAPMLVNVVSTDPPIVEESGVDYVNVCWDENNNQSFPVTFNAEGTYPGGTGYTLDDDNVTFTWEFGDGTEESGVGLTSVTHNFPAREGYTVILSIEDSQGCTNTNSMTQRVRVSRPPIWNDGGTYVDPDAICMGEEVEMCASYDTETWNSAITPAIADTIFCPDGSGVCYETSIMQNQFLPGQTLNDNNNILGICLNMEHSYLGDLTMQIQCPSGQSVQLETQGGSSTHLGEPIDPGTGPGVGYDYCFTPDGTQTLEEAAASVSTVPAGDYASYESLAGLEGCLLNGQWTISICDNWSIDDGYVFGWYIEFDESLYPEVWSYTPQYTPTEWYGLYGSEIDSPTDQNCATGTYTTTDNPDQNTQQPFIFTLTDDFGCEHDTAMNVTVYSQDDPNCCISPSPSAGTDDLVCNLSTNLNASTPESGNSGYWEFISGPGNASFADETNPNTNVTVDMYGEYEFAWTEEYLGNSSCSTSETVTIEFYEMLDPTITPIDDMCVSASPVELVIEDEGTITTSPNINTEIADGIIDPQEIGPGTYTITNTVSSPCTTAPEDEITFEIFDEIEITDFNDQTCINANADFVVQWTTVGWDGTPTTNYNVNGNPQSTTNFYDTIPSPGNYSYTVTDDNGCSNIVLEGYRDCGCPSPGTMSSLGLVTLCEGDCTGDSVSHNGDENMMGGSDLEFFIHAGDNVPLAYNSDPDFCQDTLSFNQVYYVSPLTGFDENSNGHVEDGESCYSISQGTPVMWMQNPIVDAGSTNDTCGLFIPLNGNAPSGGMIGYWTSDCDFSAVQGTNYHDPDMVAMVNDYGDCTFTWHIVNGQCVGEDDVVMHFNQDPVPFAGNDTIVCGNQIELTVEHSLPGTMLQWSGNANFNPATGTTTTVTVGTTGTYEFTLTEYNGSCYAQDKILVTFIPGPQPTIQNTEDNVCGQQYNLSVQNVTGEGQWTAYEDGTQIYPTFENNNDTSPNILVTVGNWSGQFRTVEFVWSETNSYGSVECTNDVSCEITFSKQVYAYVGDNDQPEICGNEFTFDADTTGFGPHVDGRWIIKDIPDYTIDPDEFSPDGHFTHYSPGIYGDSAHVTFPAIWSVSDTLNICSALDTVLITSYQKPNANAGNDDYTCGLSYDLEAFYSLPATSSYDPYGFWSPHSDPDVNPGTANFVDNDSAATTVNVTEPGDYCFIWRENNSLRPNCNSRDTIWIEFKANPYISAGDDFDVCGNETNLDATTDGFDGGWLPPVGGTIDDYNDPYSPVYFPGQGPVEYVWQESNDECTSKDTVVVTFWQEPNAQLAMDPEDTAVCGRKFNLRAENPGSGVNGNWIANPSNSVDFYFNTYNDTVEVTYYGHYDFNWVLSNHPDNEPPTFCSDTSEPWTVHFIETPQANAGNDTLFCG